MKTETGKLVKRWTPVRRGKVFCSPGCGADCTLAEYERAVRNGARLARAAGKGWEPRVNENMGWFYRAEYGRTQLIEHVNGARKSYTLLINGNTMQLVARGNTIKAVFQNASEKLDALGAELKVLAGAFA